MTTTPTNSKPESAFFAVLGAFLASPNPNLERAANLLSLLGGTDSAEEGGWYVPGTHPGDWDTIRATFDRELSASEILEAAGCIGYALRIYMAGEELSLPTVEEARDRKTVLRFSYDSTKAQRSAPDVAEGLAEAARYIVEGTPVRKTNRAGVGTIGTRLSAGIGPVGVEFRIR